MARDHDDGVKRKKKKKNNAVPPCQFKMTTRNSQEEVGNNEYVWSEDESYIHEQQPAITSATNILTVLEVLAPSYNFNLAPITAATAVVVLPSPTTTSSFVEIPSAAVILVPHSDTYLELRCMRNRSIRDEIKLEDLLKEKSWSDHIGQQQKRMKKQQDE